MRVPPRVSARVDQAVAFGEKVMDWVRPTLIWRTWERMIAVAFIDRSVALAAKAFVSLFPLLIMIAGLVPVRARNALVTSLVDRFGLQGQSVQLVKGAFGDANHLYKSTNVVGALLVFFFATSFTSTLQRMLSACWEVPRVKVAQRYVRGLAWVSGVVVLAMILGALRSALGGWGGGLVFLILAMAGSIVVWTATGWFLLGGSVKVRPLLVEGVAVGVSLVIYTQLSPVWMPHLVATNLHQFGFFGIFLALVSWLVGASFIIVVGNCIAASVAWDTSWLGDLARGGPGSPRRDGAAAEDSSPYN